MLSQDQVREFYDWFGLRQDSQGFYEDRATAVLIENSDFALARSVFEFGTGTGRFAEKLLSSCLSNSCRYSGIDVSSTMVQLSKLRLQRWRDRASIMQTQSSTSIPAVDLSCDRVIANYVLDLLPAADIADFVHEAHRVLVPGGLLCLVSLTEGRTWLPKAVSAIWTAAHRIYPRLVGGCRPIKLIRYLTAGAWEQRFHGIVTAFGIASEILVARKTA